MTTTAAVMDDDLTRADVIDALRFLNDTAKDMRRRGYVGTASAAYARQHSRIDRMLDTLDKLPA